jgi:hypothetical protein
MLLALLLLLLLLLLLHISLPPLLPAPLFCWHQQGLKL